MNQIQQKLLESVSALHEIPKALVAFRLNGETEFKGDEEVIITPHTTLGISGLNIKIKKGTAGKTLHLPVLIDTPGLKDRVENNFFIEDNCEITIVAGCGIHNSGAGHAESSHSGTHNFTVGKNCNVKYIERHAGTGGGKKTFDPTTRITIGEGSVFEMETAQLGGVNDSYRPCRVDLEKNARFLAKDRVLTDAEDKVMSDYVVYLKGDGCKAEIISKGVAKGNSLQTLVTELVGQTRCFGRVECDSVVLDNANVASTPGVVANHHLAELSHEATIGRIAAKQLVKLMTLGLTEEEAKNKIIEGYLS